MQKIIRLSHPLQWLCRGLIVLLPLALILFWIFATPINTNAKPLFHAGKSSVAAIASISNMVISTKHMPALGDPALGWHIAPSVSMQTILPWQRVCAGVLSMASLSFTLLILFYLSQLFGWYSEGSIFSRQHVLCFRRIAITLIIAQFCRPILDGLISLTLTWTQHGLKELSFGLDNANLFALFSSVAILLIAMIMDEGYKINQELQLTV